LPSVHQCRYNFFSLPGSRRRGGAFRISKHFFVFCQETGRKNVVSVANGTVRKKSEFMHLLEILPNSGKYSFTGSFGLLGSIMQKSRLDPWPAPVNQNYLNQIFNFISSTGVPLTASSPLTNNVVPLISRSLTSWIPILESLSGVREANTPTCLPSIPRLKNVLTERDLCR